MMSAYDSQSKIVENQLSEIQVKKNELVRGLEKLRVEKNMIVMEKMRIEGEQTLMKKQIEFDID